jgi:hypothetical protein
MNESMSSACRKDLPAFIEVDLKDLKVARRSTFPAGLPKGVKPVMHGEDDPVVVPSPSRRAAADRSCRRRSAACR